MVKNKKDRFVVYVFPNDGKQELLLATDYITREIEEENNYFPGQSEYPKYSEDKIKKIAENQGLIKLENPVQIAENQILWIDEKKGIWAADKKNPFEDENAFFVYGKDDSLFKKESKSRYVETKPPLYKGKGNIEFYSLYKTGNDVDNEGAARQRIGNFLLRPASLTPPSLPRGREK